MTTRGELPSSTTADFAPAFIQLLQPAMVAVGQAITLEVLVTGTPKPKLYWFCEKRKLRDSRNVSLTEEEIQMPLKVEEEKEVKEGPQSVAIKSQLVISSAEEFDAGKYTVRAINRAGVKSTSVNLVVKGQPTSSVSSSAILFHFIQSLYCLHLISQFHLYFAQFTSAAYVALG